MRSQPNVSHDEKHSFTGYILHMNVLHSHISNSITYYKTDGTPASKQEVQI